jgi:hypothetical protein
MSGRRLTAPFRVVMLLVLTVLGGCGGGSDQTTTSSASTSASVPARELGDLTPQELATSVEGQTADFLDRDGTALHRSLEQFLGGKIATSVAKGSAECRAGKNTASIADPGKYPFACIVEGSAAGKGLTVNITLGFVGLGIHGRCWRAADERVSVTTGAPALLTRREAMRPVNQIAGCA